MTWMREESLEAPEAIRKLLREDGEVYARLGGELRAHPPTGILTLARGSSDHAAQHAAYLIMARLGRLVTSLPMSLVTLYDARLAHSGMLVLAFSQSGQSPDLVEPTRTFTAAGARTLALVNQVDSPLAREASLVLPLHAGEERSVAATKTFIAQLVAGARIVSAWEGDGSFEAALRCLPEALARAATLDWSAGVEAFTGAGRLYVLGRGPGLALASEVALKLKETCGILAEAFSGAEVRHGPLALVSEGFPVLILATRGPGQQGLLELARDFRSRGAKVVLAAPAGTPGADVELMPAPHPDLDAVTAIQSFYPMVEALSRARAFDPDCPPNLSKVTRTR